MDGPKATVGTAALLLVASLCFASAHARKTLAAYDHQSDDGTTDDKVVFYTNSKYTGSVWGFKIGKRQSQLKELNLRGETVSKNDMYSSAKVGSDAYATIYEHDDFKGDHTDIILDVYDANTFPLNDKTSSLQVNQRPTNAIAAFDKETGDGVLQNGRAAYMSGRYPSSERMKAEHRMDNDRLSEVHVPSGVVAILYENSRYSGERAVIVGPSMVRLKDIGMNNKVSSLIVDSIANEYSVVGYWSLAALEEQAWSWEETLTTSNSQVYGSTLTQALSVAMSGGLTVMGVGVESTVKYAISGSLTQQFASSLSTITNTKCTRTCPEGESLYQWVLEASGPGGFTSTTETCIAVCIAEGLEPQCPPNYATDDNYQTCKDS